MPVCLLGAQMKASEQRGPHSWMGHSRRGRARLEDVSRIRSTSQVLCRQLSVSLSLSALFLVHLHRSTLDFLIRPYSRVLPTAFLILTLFTTIPAPGSCVVFCHAGLPLPIWPGVVEDVSACRYSVTIRAVQSKVRVWAVEE